MKLRKHLKSEKFNLKKFKCFFISHDGHVVDKIIDERIDLEKIVEVKMQIKERLFTEKQTYVILLI